MFSGIFWRKYSYASAQESAYSNLTYIWYESSKNTLERQIHSHIALSEGVLWIWEIADGLAYLPPSIRANDHSLIALLLSQKYTYASGTYTVVSQSRNIYIGCAFNLENCSKNVNTLREVVKKHRKNCECCPVSLLIDR